MGFFTVLAIASVCCTLVNSGSPEEWASRTIYFALTDRFARTGGQGGGGCSNWSDFCGGTFSGMETRLDYIQGMGFDAIWITPVITNYGSGYHGYWAKDFESIESRLGGAGALTSLVSAAHSRGMWVMVDIVANHVGPVGTDFGQINPFNSADHYHPQCSVSHYTCFTDEVYNCRLANLPDLNQGNSWVAQQLQNYISNLIKTYSFDGMRVDTVMYIWPDFWKGFKSSAGVYMVGEVWSSMDCQLSYVKQGSTDGTLDYVNYGIIRNVFGGQQSLTQLNNVLSNWGQFPNQGRYQGTFLDNHDNARFLNTYGGKTTQLKNALCWMLFARGIPIVYYGTEQGFSGGSDPANREPLWPSNYNENSDIYLFLKSAIAARKEVAPWNTDFQTKLSSDKVYAFQRGTALVIVTNQNYDIQETISGLSFASGTRLQDQINPSYYVTVNNGQVQVTLSGGMPRVLTTGNSSVPSPSPSGGCVVSTRVDCGHTGTTQAQCEASGCCWSPASTKYGKRTPEDTPWCFYPSNHTRKFY